MTTHHLQCCECEKPFTYEEDDSLDPFERPNVPYECPACQKDRRDRQRAAHCEQLEKSAAVFLRGWLPPRMAQTNREDPRFNAKLWEKVKAWQPSQEKPWLGLIGPTGRSKTRCAYERIVDQVRNPDQVSGFWIYKDRPSGMCPGDWRVSAISAVDFADAVRHQFNADKKIARDAGEFIDNARSVSWLLIDDLGKSTHTPAVASALFALLDCRHVRNRATIWTANSRPADFLANMPPDIGEPLRGRLIECSTIFELK